MEKRSQTGFTLVELMITLLVVGLAITMAVPGFSGFVRDNRLVSQHNGFISELNLARAEAIKRRQTITVCASTDQTSCNTTAWENGWLVFADADADGVVDVGDDIIQIGNGFQSADTLRSSSFTNAGRVQYASRGNIDSAGTFTVCDSRGVQEAKGININITGRARKATDTDVTQDGVVNSISGANVTCP